MNNSFYKNWASLFIPSFLVVFVYASALKGEYVWDDLILFVTNLNMHSGNPLVAITNQILPGTTYFRPLVMLSFYVEFLLTGCVAWVSHAVNICFHLINTFFVLLIARIVFKEKQIFLASGVLPAVLYGVHPGLVEAVAWASGRFDLMVTTMALLSIFTYLQPRFRGQYFFVGLAFFSAALCKEMAVVVPVVLLGLDYYKSESWPDFFQKIQCKALIRRFGWILFFGLLYLGLRKAFIPNMVSTGSFSIRPSAATSLLEHLGLVGNAIFLYVKLAVAPFYGVGPSHPLSDSNAVFWIQAVIAWSVVLLVTAFALYRRSAPSILFLLGLLALGPVVQIVPLAISNNVGCDRFLTLPLSMFVLAFSLICERWLAQWRVIFVGLGFVVILLAFVTATTVPMWRNNATLWAWASTVTPNDLSTRYNLTADMLTRGDFDGADRMLKPFRGAADNPYAALDGLLQIKLGNLDLGEKLIRDEFDNDTWPHYYLESRGLVLEELPSPTSKGFGQSWLGSFAFAALAEAEMRRGRYDKAAKNARVALFYTNEYLPGWSLLAFALYGQGKIEEGDRAFATLIKTAPKSTIEPSQASRKKFLAELCSIGIKETCDK